MQNQLRYRLNNGASLAAMAAALLFMTPLAMAQDKMETIVVTGIRASLESAMAIKRDAPQIMDAISAEDIGKFPDKDMGEALQRVTGVQITRSSGGEGATVTIRGGDPNMTRVEINGTGALSVTPNAGDRAVDFRDMPVEFISRLEVIKSPTAEMTEGGLGGTVRVITRRPFDGSGEPYLAGSAQTINSDIAHSWDPKFALIGSKLFFNDTLGVLISGTYEQSHQYDSQALTTGWLRAAKTASSSNTQGPPANRCGSYFGPSAPTTCGAGYTDYTGALQGDWYPQIPRYFNNRRNTLRYAVNSIVEYRPTESIKFYWDMTFARGKENVRNNAIQLNANGGVFDYAKTTLGDDNTVNHIELTSNGWLAGATCGYNATTNPNGNANAGCLPLDLTFRTINGYLTRQNLTTSVGFEDEITDEFTVDGRIDFARARVENEETDVTATQYGTTRAIVDYGSSTHAPNIQLPGTDLLRASGAQTLEAYFTPVRDTTKEVTSRVNLLYKPNWAQWLQLKAGFMRHDLKLEQDAWGHRVRLDCRNGAQSGNSIVVAVPCSTITGILNTTASVNPYPFYETGDLGFNDEVRTWAFLGLNVADEVMETANSVGPLTPKNVYNIYDMNVANPNANTQSSFRTWLSNFSVGEGTNDWYGQATFNFPDFYFPVSGNVGLRYVDTNTTTTGYTQVTVLGNTPANPTTCPTTANCTQYPVATIGGGYEQSLPSANLKIDFIPDQLILRLAYGKVMARPQPTQMSIGRTLDVVGHTGKQGNPGLLPFISTDYNIGLEWYFGKLNYISIAGFQKDISRFIDTTKVLMDIDNDGNPYLVTIPINGTSPVHIKGVEAGIQYTLDWLPRPFDNMGLTGNITLQSDKGYKVKNALDGGPLTFPGLSKTAWNASAYYEDEDFSLRLSYVWRSSWLITATGRGNLPEFGDSYGELGASASVNIYEGVSIFADAVNLTGSEIIQRNAVARPIYFDTFGRRLYFGIRAKY